MLPEATMTSILHLKNKDTLVLAILASFTFLLHILTSAFTDYGHFIDEFYYIACSKRLAFGYVDHPPLSIVLLALQRWLLGDSLPALRFLPSVASAATVFFTGVIARKLGGGMAAQLIAALGSIIAPVYLLFGGFYSMNVFEILVWTLIVYYVIRMFQEENPGLWLIIGLLVGLGLETKHTMILYVIALGIGMVLTTKRMYFRNRWFVYGILLAFVLLLPNIIWQILNGFPSLEFYRNAMFHKNIPTGPLGIAVGQILFMNPVTLPLWILGLVFFLFTDKGREYRAFGWCFLVLLLLQIISQSSRPDRIASIYTVLFAAGGVAVGQFAERIRGRWPVVVMISLITAGGLLYLPIAVPVLPPGTLVRYMSAIGFSMNIERGKSSELPQWFADRFGWKEMAATVGSVYHSLPAEDQRNCVILAGSYGQAGACDFYRDEYHLPPSYSMHNNYFLWGPPPDSVKTYISILVPRKELEHHFESVELAARTSCQYCMNYERNLPIYIARNPKQPVSKIWPSAKHFE